MNKLIHSLLAAAAIVIVLAVPPTASADEQKSILITGASTGIGRNLAVGGTASTMTMAAAAKSEWMSLFTVFLGVLSFLSLLLAETVAQAAAVPA